MKKFSVFVLCGALLAVAVGSGCEVPADEADKSGGQTKGEQIEEATKELMGGEIPEEDYRD